MRLPRYTPEDENDEDCCTVLKEIEVFNCVRLAPKSNKKSWKAISRLPLKSCSCSNSSSSISISISIKVVAVDQKGQNRAAVEFSKRNSKGSVLNSHACRQHVTTLEAKRMDRQNRNDKPFPMRPPLHSNRFKQTISAHNTLHNARSFHALILQCRISHKPLLTHHLPGPNDPPKPPIPGTMFKATLTHLACCHETIGIRRAFAGHRAGPERHMLRVKNALANPTGAQMKHDGSPKKAVMAREKGEMLGIEHVGKAGRSDHARCKVALGHPADNALRGGEDWAELVVVAAVDRGEVVVDGIGADFDADRVGWREVLD